MARAAIPAPEDILWQHLSDLPYFRAMLRAVEDGFYRPLDLPGPILDLGSGDGNFASIAFADRPLQVGLDPWWPPLRESKKYVGLYPLLTCADGAQMPFANDHFGSAVSVSVLEHIPHVQAVLNEVARVLQPGGLFVFCVPNDRFPRELLGVQVLGRLGLKGAARRYEDFFQKIARHQHCDSMETWRARLAQAGLTVADHWDYFPAESLHRMEVGHVLSLPALFWKKLVGRWVLLPARWNLRPTFAVTRPAVAAPRSAQGVCTFVVAQKPPHSS